MPTDAAVRPVKRHPPAQKKCRGLQIRARSERHDVAARSIRPQKARTTS